MPKKPKALVGELLTPSTKKKTRARVNAKYELSLDKKVIVTPDLIEKIKHHYSKGATLRQIAYALGIHPNTLADEVRDNFLLSRALHEGRLEKIDKLLGKAHEMAVGGNVPILIFLLKTVARLSENWKTNEDGEDVPVPPVVTLGTIDPVEAMQAYERIMRDT